MKKIRVYAMTVCALALAMGTTSCRKDSEAFKPGERMVIGASITSNDDGSKTYLHENGGNAEVYWSEGDQFLLYSKAGGQGKAFAIQSGAGSTEATFEGEAPGTAPFVAFFPTGNVSFDGSAFTYEVPAYMEYESMPTHDGPMAGYSEEGNQIQFHNAMASLYVNLKGTAKVKRVILTDGNDQNPALSGTLTVTLDENGGIASSMIEGTNHTLTVTSTNALQLDENNGTIFSFSIPVGAFAGTNNVKISVVGEYDLLKQYETSLTDGAESGKAYRVTLSDIKVDPKPVLTGEFSVAGNRKVQFTRSNIYYDGSAFHFEPTQASFQEFWNVSHVNLFYFAPWNHLSDSYIEVLEDNPLPSYCTENDIFFTNATAITPNPDFEVDGEKGQYRILSGAEWHYLMYERENAENLWTMKHITVPDVAEPIMGVIILPDGSDPAALSVITDFSQIANYGATFLTSAGTREAYFGEFSGNLNVGEYAFYWASDLYPDEIAAVNTFDAYWYERYDRYQLVLGTDGRARAHAIRLVYDVEE